MIHEGISVVGVVVALVYVSAISSILWWMLHVPPAGDIEAQVRRVVRESVRFHRIVVPVQGDVLSERLVALASQMAKFRGAALDILYIVEVPQTLPINADMSAQEAMAKGAFVKAAKIAKRYDVKIDTHVDRARQVGPAIVRYVNEEGVDIVMMSDAPKASRRGGTRYARSVEYVFEHAPCEVILDRPGWEFVPEPTRRVASQPIEAESSEAS